MEEENSRYRKLNDVWLDTIRTVRALPKFRNFLGLPQIADLKWAAKYGPVVILNISESGCHALIVTAHRDVQCVPLPEMSPDYLTKLAQSVRAINQGRPVDVDQIRAPAPNDRLTGRRERQMDPNDIFGLVLRRVWEWVVKPVLDSLKIRKTNTPARLWWCPTGAFAFLPIHAAGIYEVNGDCVSNYIISSYTPTLTLLLRSFSSTKKPLKMTAIIQPYTPGFGRLPYTTVELEKIKSRVPGSWLTTLGDSAGPPADINTVLSHLESSAIVHFACHGHQDHLNPLDSALILGNAEQLKMPQIMHKIRPLDSSNKTMSLVFLAACETAQGQDAQPDEAMHLAATLLFAGFGGAVATMWTINDSDGTKIADAFYEELFTGSAPNIASPDLRNAASALHVAVGKLRMADDKLSFSRWVPFVHFGL
ncbi:CHAT domain-containing protein [Mycena vulgaris]|nr:CHAT domain-containing protein [Mycena vulgaris]